MLGVLPGEGDAQAESEIDRLSAKVQCVVARATPSDFVADPSGSGAVALFLGVRLRPGSDPDSSEMRVARAASPVTHVTADDPPVLLIHGDQDDIVPYAQSERFRERLVEVGVKTDLIRVSGARHGPGFPGAEQTPQVGRWAGEWFDTHLLGKQP
jgi:dipeptidyl aminopeptidase/acylaminoacyl peptidase